MPFGGEKHSGVGRLNGDTMLDAFTPGSGSRYSTAGAGSRSERPEAAENLSGPG